MSQMDLFGQDHERMNGFQTFRMLRGWTLDFLTERLLAHHPEHTAADVARWDRGVEVAPLAVRTRLAALLGAYPETLAVIRNQSPLQFSDIHIKTSFSIACDAEGHTSYTEDFDNEADARLVGWLSVGDDLDFCPACAERYQRCQQGGELHKGRFRKPPIFNPELLGLDPEQWGGAPSAPDATETPKGGKVFPFPGGE